MFLYTLMHWTECLEKFANGLVRRLPSDGLPISRLALPAAVAGVMAAGAAQERAIVTGHAILRRLLLAVGAVHPNVS